METLGHRTGYYPRLVPGLHHRPPALARAGKSERESERVFVRQVEREREGESPCQVSCFGLLAIPDLYLGLPEVIKKPYTLQTSKSSNPNPKPQVLNPQSGRVLWGVGDRAKFLYYGLKPARKSMAAMFSLPRRPRNIMTLNANNSARDPWHNPARSDDNFELGQGPPTLLLT